MSLVTLIQVGVSAATERTSDESRSFARSFRAELHDHGRIHLSTTISDTLLWLSSSFFSIRTRVRTFLPHWTSAHDLSRYSRYKTMSNSRFPRYRVLVELFRRDQCSQSKPPPLDGAACPKSFCGQNVVNTLKNNNNKEIRL